jgi:hypothetical protein
MRPDRPSSPHRLRPAAITPRLGLLGAAVAAGLAGVLIAYLIHAESPPAASPAGSPGNGSQQPVAAAPVPAREAAPAMPAARQAPPPAWLRPPNDVSPTVALTELQELRDALATSANRNDEVTRLTERMLLVDATRRFLQLRGSPSPDLEELHGLVELIGPALDAQLQRGEVTRADAIELKLKLLQVQFPQASMQQGELTRWLAAQSGR